MRGEVSKSNFVLAVTNYLIRVRKQKKSSVCNPRKSQVNEQVPMGDSNCPGIPQPGKETGCQQLGGSWDNLLTQLPSGLRRAMLTRTWPQPTRKS